MSVLVDLCQTVVAGIDRRQLELRQLDLRQLEASSLAELDDHALRGLLVRLAATRAELDAAWLRLLEAIGERQLHRADGYRDVAAYVAATTGERKGQVRRDVELAERLHEVPAVVDALEGGRLSKAQAVELARAGGLPDGQVEQLLDRAAIVPVERLGDAVTQARLDHGLADERPPARAELGRTSAGVRLEATLDAEGGEVVDTALRAAVDLLQLPTDVPIAERRAMALVSICRNFLDHAESMPTTRTGRAHLLALVPLATLEARTGGSATLASGAVLNGATARRLACDAGVARVITGPSSEILDVGRSARSVPVPTARAVIARDRHCCYEGCHAPPWACEIHHLVPWGIGGATDLQNLGLLCWYHHQRTHEHEATHDLERRPDGTARLVARGGAAA